MDYGIGMTRELPPVDVDRVSQTAYDAAELVLEGFFQQDLREESLLDGDAAGARAAADACVDAMAEVFCVEFPDRPRELARSAGSTFARALFLQDEIENWRELRAVRDDLPDDLFVSDRSHPYDGGVRDDPRWEDVRRLLSRVCADAGIDDAYGDRQTEFWRRHGLRDDDWAQTALEAHRLKLAAMVAGSDDDVDVLAEFFVASVELHDRWERVDPDRDFREIRHVVAAYYQSVFELRGEIPSV